MPQHLLVVGSELYRWFGIVREQARLRRHRSLLLALEYDETRGSNRSVDLVCLLFLFHSLLEVLVARLHSLLFASCFNCVHLLWFFRVEPLERRDYGRERGIQLVNRAHVLDVYAFRVNYLVNLILRPSGLVDVFEMPLFGLVHCLVGCFQFSLHAFVLRVFLT